jgi:hypothetical protein
VPIKLLPYLEIQEIAVPRVPIRLAGCEDPPVTLVKEVLTPITCLAILADVAMTNGHCNICTF